MRGNPLECRRRHTLRCAELAMAARTPQLKTMFLELSKNRKKLAIQDLGAHENEPTSSVLRTHQVHRLTACVRYDVTPMSRAAQPIYWRNPPQLAPQLETNRGWQAG
jgi:hypothetical protein